MPSPGYLNIAYLFYQVYLYLKKGYFFLLNLPWLNIIFWVKVIAVIIITLFAISIIYNLFQIFRILRSSKE